MDGLRTLDAPSESSLAPFDDCCRTAKSKGAAEPDAVQRAPRRREAANQPALGETGIRRADLVLQSVLEQAHPRTGKRLHPRVSQNDSQGE